VIAVAKSAPDSDVVKAIVEELKPWQHSWNAEEVRRGVTERISLLQGTVVGFFSTDAKVKTRSDAVDILKTIGKLRELFRKASPELKERLYLFHRPKLFRELALIEQECGILTPPQKKKGRSKDEVKQWCARMAHSLIVRYSEEEPTSGSAHAPFRAIAVMLYRCVQPDHKGDDLRRPCSEVLEVFRAAGISVRKPQKRAH
jgi:hypothetical protein